MAKFLGTNTNVNNLVATVTVTAPKVGTSAVNDTLALGNSIEVRTGHSGSGYPFIGYNVNATASVNSYTYATSDTAWAIDFGYNNAMTLKYAPAGTGGNAITFSSLLSLSSSGVMTTNTITASGFVKSSGTSSQFLKADGSVDSNTYVTSSGTVNKLYNGTITDLNSEALGLSDGQLRYSRYQMGATGQPVNNNNNANGVLTLVSHPTGGTGVYGKQIAFADSDEVYIRKFSNGSFGSWYNLIHSGNIISQTVNSLASGPYTNTVSTNGYYWRLSSSSGYVDIGNGNGPGDTTYFHISTGNSKFYMNKQLDVVTSLSIYGSNTWLQSTGLHVPVSSGSGDFYYGSNAWVGTTPALGGTAAATGIILQNSTHGLFTFSSSGGVLSLQTDGSLFIGDNITYNPHGINGSYGGYLIAQGGLSAGGAGYFNGSIVGTASITSGGNYGFRNDVYYANQANPIWAFGNATTYGISYYQGSGLFSQAVDAIGCHFGTIASPKFAIDANGVLSSFKGTNGSIANNIAAYYIGGGTQTGTIRISLPAYTYCDNGMISLIIRGYDYTTKNAWSLQVGGYIYSANAGGWHPPACNAIGTNCPFSSVRFVKDSGTGKPTLLLGTTASTWSYAGIAITEAFFNGYNNYVQGLTGWSIDRITTESVSVAATINPEPVKQVYRGSGGAMRMLDTSNGLTYELYVEGGNLKLIQV